MRWLVRYLTKARRGSGTREGHGESCGSELEAAGGVNREVIHSFLVAMLTWAYEPVWLLRSESKREGENDR